MKNDKSSNSSAQDENDDFSLSPVSDLIDVTDKALDKMYKNASQIFENYSDIWSDSLDDSLSSSVPTFFRDRADAFINKALSAFDDEGNLEDGSHTQRPWGFGPWGRARRSQIDGNTFQVEGLPVSNSSEGFGQLTTANSSDSNAQVINLDESKPKNIYSYLVPSGPQYEQCKELDGTSVWTKEGLWRCLFPASSNDQHVLDAALSRSKANGPNFFLPKSKASLVASNSSNEELLKSTQVFPDFSTYLDWRSGVRKALRENHSRARAEWKSKFDKNVKLFGNQSDGVVTTSDPGHLSKTKYITEEEAEQQNKQIVSSSFASSTVTKDDGSLETKEVVKKWYSDGTASVTESVKNSKDGHESKGWFWK